MQTYSPVHYQYNPIKTTKTSVMGAMNMLGLAKRVRGRILQGELACNCLFESTIVMSSAAVGPLLLHLH
jgi:hypothetical protein